MTWTGWVWIAVMGSDSGWAGAPQAQSWPAVRRNYRKPKGKFSFS